MPESIVQRSFAAGELSPAHAARADLVKYLTGLKTAKNFFVRKEGGISNRAGLRYVATTKANSSGDSEEAILLRYVSEQAGESVLIEMGDGYFRFFLNGAPVEVEDAVAWDGSDEYLQGDIVSVSGVNYYAMEDNTGADPASGDPWYPMPGVLLEIPHHFGQHKANWSQSGQVITLTHGEAAAAELVYGGITTWVLRLITTEPWAAAPANGMGTAGAVGTRNYAYVVTAARLETYEETEGSTPIAVALCAEPTADAPNVLTWDAVTGAAEYYVYCDQFENGVFGFIGTAATNAFNDPGIISDFAVTPPIARDIFAGGADPHVSVTHQQRRTFANFPGAGDQVDMSRTGFPFNFGISSPLQDDDAIRFQLAGSSNHAIQWAVSLTDLILGTGGGLWAVRGTLDGGVLAPGAVDAKENVHAGAHDKAPIVAGNTIIYLQARGKVLRDARFNDNVGGLDSRDLTIFSGHLFEPSTFARIDYAETPHSIVWCIRNDGVLLGLTYIPDQEIWGWHRHETQNGDFEEVCVIPEAGEDIAYFIVRRTIDGETVRYIERMESRYIPEGDGEFAIAAFFVDSGLSYHGDGANSFSGLDHLDGQVVAVLADGEVIYDGDPDGDDAETFTIAGGELDLPGAELYEDVHIGLPIRYADAETLALDVQGSGVLAANKRVGSVTILVDRSSRGFLVGPDADNLTTDAAQSWEGSDTEFTGQIEVNVDASFNPYGRVFIRQPNPLPLTILGIVPNVELGG